MVTKDELKEAVKKIDISQLKVRAGAAFKLDDIPKEKLDKLVYMASHCNLNGPVGVKVKTTWPGADFGECSIQSVHEIVSSQWKAFCALVEDCHDKNSEEVKTCYCVKSFGSTWPTCDPVFKPKKKDKAE